MVIVLTAISAIIVFIFGALMGKFAAILVYRTGYISGTGIMPLCRTGCNQGKCRKCGFEILGGLLAMIALFAFGLNWTSLIVFLVMETLLFICMTDLNTMRIPDGLNIALFVLGLVSAFHFTGITWAERLEGLFIISTPMFLLSLIVKNAFGGGDIKLMAAAGVLLGWKLTLTAGLIGLFIGGCQGTWMLFKRKKTKDDLFAFGPALSAGIGVSLLYGQIF